MKEKLKQELQTMVSRGVICKVGEHTNWCSSLAYSTKNDGSIRVCIDPQRLNAALRRCPRKIPTLAKLLSQLHGCESRILVGTYRRRFTAANHVSHTIWQILLAKTPLWVESLAGHISSQNGPDPGGSRRGDWDWR